MYTAGQVKTQQLQELENSTKQNKPQTIFLHFLIIPNSQNNMMYLNSTSVLNGAFLSLIIALNQSSFLFCCFGLKDKLIKYFGTNQKAQTENLPKFSVILIISNCPSYKATMVSINPITTACFSCLNLHRMVTWFERELLLLIIL